MLALELVAALLIGTGSAVVGFAAIGVLRLDDPFMRMHAATKAGVVGAGLVMLGAGLSFGTVSGLLTGLAGMAFLLLTSPIAAHALGRAAYVAGAPLSPATMADALEGVLPRNVVDLGTARGARASPPAAIHPEEGAMTAVLPWNPPSTAEATDLLAVRRVTTWLIGGPAQAAASELAFDLARQSGAEIAGLTAIDPAAVEYRGPLPIGGAYWARWLAEKRRTRMRNEAAAALSEFERFGAAARVNAATRHEEGDLASIAAALAGTDLLILPAGVDRNGQPADAADEAASMVAQAHLAPVLRVQRRPAAMRRVLLLVGGSPGCPRLAQGLIRTGLWPDARIAVVPVAAGQPAPAKIAAAQVELLQAHGREAQLGEAFDLAGGRAAALERIRAFDAAVMGVLSNRTGWFAAVREDMHEIVAETVPLILLP